MIGVVLAPVSVVVSIGISVPESIALFVQLFFYFYSLIVQI